MNTLNRLAGEESRLVRRIAHKREEIAEIKRHLKHLRKQIRKAIRRATTPC